jgi:hypothetical protein
MVTALLYTAGGFFPGRVMVPLDLLRDTGAWKPDPAVRVRVSNPLLSDPVVQFVPWDAEARRLLGAREIPWVNAFSGSGALLFANPSAALLSPFTWPRLTLGLFGWTLCLLLKLLAAGFGMRALARELGATPFAAAASGFAFQTCGYAVLWSLHPHTNVFSVLPWLALAGLRCLRAPSPSRVAWLAAAAFLATVGGHHETLAFGVTAIAIFLAISQPAGWRPALSTAGAALAGFLLAAIQVVPFLHLALTGSFAVTRAGQPVGGLRLFAIAGEVLPGILGSPLAREIDLTGAVPGSENFISRSAGYAGLLVLVVIVLAWKRLGRELRVGLWIGLAGLALAWRLPPVGLLWRKIPGFGLMAPEYGVVAFALFATLAAGPALEAVMQSERRWKLAGSLLAAAGVALALAGALPALPWARPALLDAGGRAVQALRARGSLPHPAEVYEARMSRYLDGARATALRRVALPGLLWALAGFALAGRRGRRVLLPAAAAGELLAFGLGFVPAIPVRRIPGPPPSIQDLGRVSPGGGALIAAAAELYPPDLATLARVRDVRRYDLLETRSENDRLVRCGYDPATRSFSSPDAERVACLASLGVGYFLSREPVPLSERVGGLAPPGVGLYALPGVSTAGAVAPRNQPPRGFAAGAAMSVAGLGIAVLIAWSSRRPRQAPVFSQTDRS